MSDLSARQVQVRLERLTPDIKASYQQAKLHAMETVKYALTCGRKLNEAQELVRHGEFGRFMVETLDIHPRTASRYMKLAQAWPRIEHEIGPEKAALLTITEGLAKATKSPPKGGKMDSVSEIPPSEETEDTDVWLDDERAEAIEPIGTRSNSQEEDSSARGSDNSANGSDRRYAVNDLEVQGHAGPTESTIDAALRPVQQLVADLNKRCPNEKLWSEADRGLDIVFAALMSWRNQINRTGP